MAIIQKERHMGRILTAIVFIVLLVSCRQAASDENTPSSISPAAAPTSTPAAIADVDTVLATMPAASPTSAEKADAQPESSAEESTATPAAALEPSATDSGPEPTDTPSPQVEPQLQEYLVPQGSRPHDVAPAPDGTVWYTAQRLGELGRLDPSTDKTHHIPLGNGSAPHGVIVGPAGAAWVTDGGLNAIVRVDPATEEVLTFPMPAGTSNVNLNTATFDANGILWFTGQNGVYGRLDTTTGQVEVYEAPNGRGPYGIATSPEGDVYYASLAGSYVGRVDLNSGEARVLEPPTPGQGARRVWPDSSGRIWVSEWNAGQLASLDPATGEWREWLLPGERPMPYAVYVDEEDMIWLSDFGANALVRFDPVREEFQSFPIPSPGANVRQILGRQDEVWGAESGADKLVVVRMR
jgi:virginiamycin B lyase